MYCYHVYRKELLRGFSEWTHIGDCHTLKEAMELIMEFNMYDWPMDFQINGRNQIEYYEMGLYTEVE